MPNPTAAILTLGCKVNQYESEAIAEGLVKEGFAIRPTSEVCDLYIINSCTVTSESDRKARQAIRRLIKQNPAAYVMVTGCAAQIAPEKIAAIPGVDAVIGNRNKMDVVTIAVRLLASGRKNPAADVDVPSLAGASFEPMTITRFDRTRAYVKIQDGCESRCSYCTIPRARGPLRSKPMDEVIREVTALTETGCREIVLTGIETGAWGKEWGTRRLQDLLVAVDAIPGIGRIRLGSLDPTVMTEAFVAAIAPLASTAPHFHLSMQSGCSATLARMKRTYNVTMAEAAMARVRAGIPNARFTTDIIVGFPGETEEEFAETLAFARRAEFLHIHVFPYSRRDDTPAATMPNQVPEAVKHERVARLSAVSRETCGAILDRTLARCQATGEALTVLFESRVKGFWHGHTPDFMEVKLPIGQDTPCDLSGRELRVRPEARDGEALIVALI